MSSSKPRKLIEQIHATTATIIEEEGPSGRPSISASEILDIGRPASALYYLRKNLGHVRKTRHVRQEIPAFHNHNLSHDLRQDALIMPHPTLARRCLVVPFLPRATRPRAIQQSSSSMGQNTVPFERVDQPHDHTQYILLTPTFPLDNSAALRNDLEAMLKHNNIRSEYPPVNPKDRVELALIKKERHPVPAFVMTNPPWETLVPGTAVECIGELTGDWEVTHRVERRGKGTYSLWVNDGKRRKAWVRVDDRAQGPGVTYRIKWAFKKARAFFASPDPSLTDAALPYY
ncbi:hypothetical protein C8R44DRAFT_742578 [Mycena epipterygia]|nr:hypothetical protein C8R44DRAFT_742578 [Mycena epipterygia]